MALTGLANGELSLLSGAVLILLGIVSGVLGGAAGGILVGGKSLGNELAAMMGAFFGPIASVPGVIAGLLILAVLL